MVRRTDDGQAFPRKEKHIVPSSCHLHPLGHPILESHSGDLSPTIMRASTKPHGDHRLHPHLVEEHIKAAKEEGEATNASLRRGIDIRELGKEAVIVNN